MELELGTARLIRNFNVEFNHSTKNAFRSALINLPNITLKFKFTDVPTNTFYNILDICCDKIISIVKRMLFLHIYIIAMKCL